MTDRTSRTRFEAQIGQWEAAMATMAASTKGVAKEIDGMGARSKGSFKSMGMDLVGVGAGEMAVAAGAAVAGAAVLKFTSDGVKSYIELAGKVKQYKNVTGESAEDSSRMVAVADALGVSIDTVANGMFRFSRNANEHADVLKADGVVVALNARGQIDLAGSLTNVGDAYRKAGAGAAGNKVLFDAFGRSGASMIPILKQDREQLEAIYEAAAKHHQIYSQDDLDKTFQFKVATRELHEALTGMEREAGQAAVPALTSLTRVMTTAAEDADKVGNAVGRFIAVNRDGIEALTGLVFGHHAASDAAHEHAVQEQHAADAMAADAKAASELAAGLDELYASAFGLEGAQSKFNKDLIDFADKVKAAKIEGDRWASSLDDATATGVANQEMVRGLAKDIFDTAKAARVQGEDVVAATDVQRQALVLVLEQLGFNQAEAERYTATLAGIPAQIATTVTLNLDTSGIGSGLKSMFTGQNLDVLKGATDAALGGVASQAPLQLPQGVLDAIAGRGPAARSALKQQNKEDSQAARDAEAVNDYLRSVFEQRGEILKNTFETTGGGLKEYEGWLDEAIGREVPFTDKWVQLQKQKEDAATHFTEVLKGIRDMQRAYEDNMAAAGVISNEQYLVILRQRLAGLQMFSNEWMTVWHQIESVAKDAADKIHSDTQAAFDKATKVRDDAFSKLNAELDQERQIRKQMEDQEAQHYQRLSDLQSSYLGEQAAALDQRRQQLLGWAAIDQHVTVAWGNTVAALTGNVQDQFAQFNEWVTALDDARHRGVSEAVISMLGLDEGPAKLGQLRMFSSATQAEIDGLNTAVEQRTKQTQTEVTRESNAAYSALSSQLASLAAKYHSQVETATADFLKQQKDDMAQLAAIGQDGARSFGDAIALGLLSSIPAIQDAARQAADALRRAKDADEQAHAPGGFVNPGTGRTAVTGPHGEAGLVNGDPRGAYIPGLVSWTNPATGTLTWYVPGQNIDPGNVAALNNMPHYAGGTSFVPDDGPAFLHRGERVVTALENAKLVAALGGVSGGSSRPMAQPSFTIQVFDANGMLVTDDRIRVVVQQEQGATGRARAVQGSRQ